MVHHLDLAVLRSFVLIAEGRSFVQAADAVGRSPSAVSLQIRKLEEALGAPVLRRNAREVALTLTGERLLGHARRLLNLNDEALAELRAGGTARPLRFGTTQDFAEAALPELLRRFALEHPETELTLRIDRSQALVDAVRAGGLDAAVAVRRDDPLLRGVLLETPMLWIGAAGLRIAPDRPVPLCLFDPPCGFRAAALDRLAAAGRAARVAFTSPSLAGLRAAVRAGVGLTARTRHLLDGTDLADLGGTPGLPALPTVAFALYADTGERWAAREDLLELCRRVFR